MIVDKYDKNKDGVLDKGEVKSMCEHIMEEISPGLGGVTDEDVELVMRLGGAEAKDTIQPEEVPKALSLVLAIKKVRLRCTFVVVDFSVLMRVIFCERLLRRNYWLRSFLTSEPFVQLA